MSLFSVTEVGTARASWAEGPETHQASATDMRSAQGLRGSPYLPRPECSSEENENITSKTSKVLSLNCLLKSAGLTTVQPGYSLERQTLPAYQTAPSVTPPFKISVLQGNNLLGNLGQQDRLHPGILCPDHQNFLPRHVYEICRL